MTTKFLMLVCAICIGLYSIYSWLPTTAAVDADDTVVIQTQHVTEHMARIDAVRQEQGPQQTGPVLTISVTANQHTISPDIYGISFADYAVDEALATALNLPVGRWGGDRSSRYNWKNDTFNHNTEQYYENIAVPNTNPNALPTGSSADRFVEDNKRVGAKSMMTIPMIGWAPKDRQFECSFRVSKYGAQQQTDAVNPDCGNGVAPDESSLFGTPEDRAVTSVATDVAFAEEWLAHLISRFGTADNGGVAYYALGNEPMVWNEVHRDVYLEPLSYDELRARSYTYGAAIKQADPAAKTFGPVFWGWTAYFWSALDKAGGKDFFLNPQDRLAHENTPLVDWYLQQMKAYEEQNGTRILDYLDLHFYPRVEGIALEVVGDGEPTDPALRLRSTRALWDPTYVDESWINSRVQLIPRMRQWVAQNYPGTKIALSEYNWGALDHINGALAQADILGILGRERVDLATLWEPLGADEPFAYAFRIYRNYDGAGSTFGDISVNANSTNQEQMSVYAAQSHTDALTRIIVINKTTDTLTSLVNFQGFYAGTKAKVYRYSDANLNAIEQLPDQAMKLSSFTGTFPGNSITLFEVPMAEQLFLPVVERN